MLKIIDKSKCCGCNACGNICPKDAIIMQHDNEGFLYPYVNETKCIKCELCIKICPIINKYKKNADYKCDFIGGYNKDKNILKDSSSGGIFWLLVENIIAKNGVIYGVELGDNFYVFHNRSETLNESKKFMKSKYLESNIGLIYRKVKNDLENKLYVLFSGTPCQIAGLYSYLGQEYSTLYTCDVICHGVPSKIVFDKYIQELNIHQKAKAVSICWRDKIKGWGPPNRVTVYFDNNEKLTTSSMKNPYQAGFLKNLYLRPSCYKCNWAKLPRIGDISLADFWNYEGKLSNDNKGLSIIILSSAKGYQLFNEIKKYIEYEFVSEQMITRKSRHVHLPPLNNKKRDLFFRDFNKYSFKKLSKKYIYNTIFRKLLSAIKWKIYKIITK
jgi:coenzyme F420-reducing hydrogenase beta subunit